MRSASLSPNGKRVVFEARGEIITVPREHGNARNLTRSPGTHERNPVWSPDGERVAWFSDAGGEYQLWVRDREGKKEPRSFSLGNGGFYYGLQWSPDSRHLLFQDKSNRLAYLTVETGRTTRVTTSEGSLGVVWISADWSPDSKWIAFEQRNSKTLYDQIALYRCADGSVTVITDGFGDSGGPAFSSDGKLLLFTSSVESGPTRFGLDMETSAAKTPQNHLYAVVLQKDGRHPFGPRNDTGISDGDDSESSRERDEDEESSRTRSEKKDLPVLELDGIDQRIVAVPLPSGRYQSPTCTEEALYVLNRQGGETVLLHFDLEEREKKTIASGVRSYELSHDEKSFLLALGSGWEIRQTKGDDRHSLAIDEVKVRVDPSLEWPQLLREAWRIERDYFYDPGMHGVDWDAMWERWSAFLPHVRHRSDLTLLLAEMIGELACGHNYVSGGEYPDAEEGVPTGLLGADFVEAGNRFRVSRILRGQNWNPSLRAPLTVPGVDVREGDYLISVDGVPLTTAQNFFSAFENTANRQIELVCSSSPDGRDPRASIVVPVGSERSLRRLSWVEDNRRRVDELSGGRLAYVYMPNTGSQGMAAFDRDYYSQLDKQGLVLDERFNGGGKVADYVVHVLSRETLSFWMNREQWVGRSPFGMIAGPKIMIINERAGSGGDWMPWA
ncbi:MAG: PDZ domain-containing protein, partial [Planctomycetota bacterium]